MLKIGISIVFILVSGLPALADRTDEIEALSQALSLPEIVEILREEGVASGEDIEGDLFPQSSGGDWQKRVNVIYDGEMMENIVLEALFTELAATDLDPLLEYFSQGPGHAIVELELGARIAMLDDEIEAAGGERAERLRAQKDPLIAQISRYIDANDLLEYNVVGAMNSNYAFYQGLVDGGAFEPAPSEDQILSDVWAQELEIRNDAEEWLYSFMSIAYGSVAPKDLEAYVAISETPEGQDLNRALFTAFDRMFVFISRELGLAAAQVMDGQDL